MFTRRFLHKLFFSHFFIIAFSPHRTSSNTAAAQRWLELAAQIEWGWIQLITQNKQREKKMKNFPFTQFDSLTDSWRQSFPIFSHVAHKPYVNILWNIDILWEDHRVHLRTKGSIWDDSAAGRLFGNSMLVTFYDSSRTSHQQTMLSRWRKFFGPFNELGWRMSAEESPWWVSYRPPPICSSTQNNNNTETQSMEKENLLRWEGEMRAHEKNCSDLDEFVSFVSFTL